MPWRTGITLIVLLLATLTTLAWLAPPRAERQAASGLPASHATADPDAGQAVFREHCARCHGPDLGGTDQGPPLLHPYYRPDHHSDLAFYLAVKNGVVAHHWGFGDMPPVAAVGPEQTRDIIAWVRGQQRQSGLIAGN